MPALIQNATATNLLDGVAHAAPTTGSTFALPVKAGVASWQTVFGSAPGAATINLQVSNDGTNWTTIDTSTSTAGETRQIAAPTALFVRATISAAAGGSTTTVIFVYKGYDFQQGDSAELLFSTTQQVGNAAGGLEVLQTFTIPADKLRNNGDSIYLEAAVQLAANGNNKTTALGGFGVTLASRGAAENNLPRVMRARIIRTGASTQQSWGATEAQGQATLITLQAPVQPLNIGQAVTVTVQGVAANDLISRYFSVWYIPVRGIYVNI